jgi:hypothetical protein
VSEVVYARVPGALKQALSARARERQLSLNATVRELLEDGLAASGEEHSRNVLEDALARAARELEETRARVSEAELRCALAEEREEMSAGLLTTLAERARQELAECPRCRQPVRGYDFLVSGHCPHCGKALTALLAPRPQVGASEPSEYLALLGALGAVLGLASAGFREPHTRETKARS